MLGTAVIGSSSFNQRETRCTGQGWFRALINITHCEKKRRKHCTEERDSNTHTSQNAYHTGTEDNSCWWSLDWQPEFLHESKLEWAQCMTHTLPRQKMNSYTALIYRRIMTQVLSANLTQGSGITTYHKDKSSSRISDPWLQWGTDLPCSQEQRQEGMPWGHTLRKIR